MTKKLIYCLIIAATGGALRTYGQNTPLLTQTAPAGSVTTPAATPPAITVNSSELFNYVRSYVPKQPVTDATTLSTATPPATAAISTTYLDGFQRNMETVTHNFTTGKSLVQPVDTRFQQQRKGYLPYTAAGSGFRNNAFSEQSSYYSALYSSEGTSAYTKAENLSDADGRTVASYLPGKSQVGQARRSATRMVSNDANTVRIWKLNASGAPVSPGYFGVSELFGEETTTSEGGSVVTFSNKEGRVIYKKELLETVSVGGGGTALVEGITYYVYDALGRLCFILPPRATQLIGAGTTVSTTILNNLCFQYQYGSKGRMMFQRMPGEVGSTAIVYDRKDRVVMRCSPLQAAMGKWEVTFYDKAGRVVATSLYTSSATQASLQTSVDGVNPATMTDTTNLFYYLGTDAGERQPAAISGNEMMSFSYYDHYGYSTTAVPVLADAFSAASFPDAPGDADLPATRSLRTQGMLVASRVKVIKGSGTGTELGDWIETVNYYDDKGRVIQQRTRNATKSGSTAGKEIVCTYYDFRGKPLLGSHYHENKKTGHAATEYTRYSYDDATGRLTETGHKVNEDSWRTLNIYSYDDLGRVNRKVLGNYGEVQDYSYNIRGQLTGINADYAETGNKGFESRSYGELLRYDYGFSQVRYDGKLTGMVWRGAGGTAARAMSYGYSYDKAGRLTAADFRKNETGGWSNATTDYTVSALAYDVNGNLTRMKQMGMGLVGSSVVRVVMDTLNYIYETSSNRLARVEDMITTDYNIGDFINGNVNTTDYTYDVSGNLTKDLNKGITSITYTHFNKPQTVTFSNGNVIKYIYDATGGKIQELVITGSVTKKTDYVGNFLYQDDVLSYINTAEGRTVYTPADGTYKEEFLVKDHLGNVRSVVDVQTAATAEYLASYEVASAHLEGLVFDKVSEIAEDNPVSGNPANMQSGLLNGGVASKRVGTSLLLKVMAGDRVELNVNSYYQNYNPGTDAPVNASTMLSSIVSTLTSGTGGLGGSESHNPQMVGAMFNSTNYTQFNSIISSSTDGSKPKAYLNYILFNQQMQMVGTFSGAFQANGNGTWSEIGTTEPMEIPQNGYLAIYLSGISNYDVYFDQLLVRFTKGRLLEETHYYPHGLPMGNIGSTAMGFTPNRKKHQSNEYIKDAGLNWMDFNFRQYDPQTGRFLSVDPLAAAQGQEVHSPYAAMGNQPEMMMDPNGLAANPGMYSLHNKGDAFWAAVGAYYSNPLIGTEFGSFASYENFMSNRYRSAGEAAAAESTFQDVAQRIFVERLKMSGRGVMGIYGYVSNFGPGGGSGGDPGDGSGNKSSNSNYKVITYTSFFDKSRSESGFSLEIVYTGSQKGYSKFEWIQSVITNTPGTGQPYNKWFNDYLIGNPNTIPPFYYGKDKNAIRNYNNETYGGIYFDDAPGRWAGETKNYYFQANLNLVGLKNGVWESIISFSWGFMQLDGKIYGMPLRVTNPNRFSWDLINDLNK